MKQKQPFVVAILAKDAVEQIPVVIPAHEVVVLAAVHGQNRVSVDEAADLPGGLTDFEFDPDEEWSRLEMKYGSEPDTKQSYAQVAFGSRHNFLAMLPDADEEEAPKKRGRKAAAAPAEDA